METNNRPKRIARRAIWPAVAALGAQSGDETLATWRHFRSTHVAEEAARAVRFGANATRLRFGSGQDPCVIDSYSTPRPRFREIACIVAGVHATTVVVAAAPTGSRAGQLPLLERAVSSFTT